MASTITQIDGSLLPACISGCKLAQSLVLCSRCVDRRSGPDPSRRPSARGCRSGAWGPRVPRDHRAGSAPGRPGAGSFISSLLTSDVPPISWAIRQARDCTLIMKLLVSRQAEMAARRAKPAPFVERLNCAGEVRCCFVVGVRHVIVHPAAAISLNVASLGTRSLSQVHFDPQASML